MNTDILDVIYNEGERLIPFVTHNDDEVIRHFSSYNFFTKIIKMDLDKSDVNEINVLDVGFGCGYGCFIFSKIPGVKQVTGIDVSYACKSFAQENYGARNIDFVVADAAEYLAQNQPFSYITSRGVLEHIPNGLNLTKNSNYDQRLIIDVPYNEKSGNQHHVIVGIKEDAFQGYENYELFYEGLDGTIYDTATKPSDANMILCVASRKGLARVSEMFDFPIQPVSIEYVKSEMLARSEDSVIQSENRYFNYKNPTDLLLAVENAIQHVDVVLDIGPGIVPMNYFRPKFHILLEPFDEYVQILTNRFANDGSVFVISGTSQNLMSSFAANSVDTVFLLDVIEHLTKDDGVSVLVHAERVARKQIIVFTPLGFMPQTVHEGEKDGWGLGGASVQEHLSGWVPEDFGAGWDFHICETFHKVDFRNQLLSKEYGAFFAIKNFFGKPTPIPQSISDIRKLLPSEVELEKVRVELMETKAILVNTQNQLVDTQNQLVNTQNQLVDTQNQLQKISEHLVVRVLRKGRTSMINFGKFFIR
ncbi:methyltransferase domain-containing protein [Nostoc sphaeroides CHAB 2801]|uniref:class I SAM-dependent methyltransferase n=1 Tax=Nostoc sphaeroides TaxID=446679 RepID=UPI000E4C0EBE|nr:class I SAM-dependent methyltransferase [Nostoc sphaeroides]MCC5629686.1 methyltransferase domain-containing protein [Nostoc sphaeroides CHAB 2801]